ncbi:MAG TPA: hypothetical protein VGM98_12700 [Schlesneria sp.]|jgi:hypothetical protein
MMPRQIVIQQMAFSGRASRASMMSGFGPIEAAIIGIVVWCLGKYGVPILKRIARSTAPANANAEAQSE